MQRKPNLANFISSCYSTFALAFVVQVEKKKLWGFFAESSNCKLNIQEI